ncbi:PAS domain-containing protein [Ideonella livida]|uniref:histidine kinase n=1 Tax=Ideonella livida TaxID=2707176 RepID=A0A7C9TMC1_9BURK|nr:PAS domain-containing protein [Ideonella livida]NDY92525.1 PAS domain-containing protein [Ideonella livida]
MALTPTPPGEPRRGPQGPEGPASLAARLSQGGRRMVRLGMALVGSLSLVVIVWLLLQRADAELVQAGQDMGQALQRQLGQSRAGLAELARRSLVRNALVDPAGRAAYLSPTLREHRAGHPALAALWLTDHRGEVLARAEGGPGPMAPPADLHRAVLALATEVLRTERAGERLVQAEGRWWWVLGEPVVFATTGTTEGSLVGWLDLGQLVLPELAGLAPRWHLALRHQGVPVLVAGPGQAVRTAEAAPGAAQPGAWRMFTRRWDLGLARRAGMPAAPGFELSLAMPWHVALGPAVWVALGYLLTGWGLLALVVRRTGRLAEQAVAPLRELQQAAQLVAGQGLDASRPLRVVAAGQGGSEVLSLTASFEAMLHRLAEAQASLEEQVARRTAELTQAKRRLDDTLASLSDGVYALDPEGRELVFASPPTWALLGLAQDATPMVRDCLARLLRPQDWQAQEAARQQALATGRACVRLPLHRPGQPPRWLENRMTVQRDAQGEPLRIDGLLTDITATVQATHDREQAQAGLRLRDRALASTGNGVLILAMQVDGPARAVYANPAMAQISGTSLEDLLSLDGEVLAGHVVGDEVREALRACVLEHRDVRTTTRLRRRDGSQIWCDITISPMAREDDLPTPQALGGRPWTEHVVVVLDDVTAQHHAQETLELRNRAIDASHNGIVLTDVRQPGGPMVFVNEGFTRLTGYTRQQALGRSCSFLQGPERDQPGLQALRHAIEAGQPCRVVLSNYRRDGRRFDNDLSIAPLRDEATGEVTHYIGVLTDITSQLHSQRLLADQFARLDAILALSPDGFVSFDAQGHAVSVNPAFERLTGLPVAELIGLSGPDFEARMADQIQEVNPPGVAHWLAELGQDATGDPEDAETRAVQSDVLVLRGPPQRVVVRSVRECSAASVTRVMQLRDITRETEVDRMKSEFLSTAAHELRTPMASIRGFSDLLLMRKFDEARTRDILQTINRQSIWLTDMVNELLDLARIEARKGKDFTLECCPLQDLVQAGVQGLLVPGDTRKVQVDLPEAPVWVSVDRAKFQHALGNVLSNAYKYSPGGGEIHLAVLSPAAPGARVGVQVRDQGIGMSPEHARRAFERFFRADASGNIPGTGLGLALVKEIVELHGGEVALHSALGEGTTVTLWWPACEPPPSSALAADAPAPEVATAVTESAP